jgi:precorrin-2/cobalt-factor-2 C20-methyltransferase
MAAGNARYHVEHHERWLGMSGTLFGIGVGPGDPELLTLKAYRLLRQVRVIAYPAPDSGESFARKIVASHLSADQLEIPIVVPMRTDRFPAREVYDAAALDMSRHLDAGDDIVVLCEGDPFFYGSFMYLFERLAAKYPCEIVPGVSSVMAAGACLKRPLAARNDVLTVIPAPLDDTVITRHLESADAVAIIKIGRHFKRINTLLQTLDLAASAFYVERLTLSAQRIMALADVEEETAPYFSMILIYKGAEDWIADLRLDEAVPA